MAENRHTELVVGVNPAPAKAGLNEIKQEGQSLAQSLAQSGKQAGQGLEGGITAAVKRASAEMNEARMTWNQFTGSRMGPLMKQFSDEGLPHKDAHTKAIRQIAEEWKEYKKAGISANDAVKGAMKDAIPPIERLSAAQNRFLDSLTRQSVQLSQGRGAWLEMRAAQLGLADAASPYIAKIKEAEKAQVSLGMSAKQTAHAIRGVPAQLTDIFTSLQAGQNPMTVMLQQGGQLKDMFGGIVPAAKALGASLLGLVNPYTVSAAAVVGLAAAYNKGSKEADEYAKALIMTGNASGTSINQLQAMAANVDRIVGTHAEAAAALAQLAATGRVASNDLERFAEVALKLETSVGIPVSETVKHFEDLGKSPVEASQKLNEKYRHLTASVYEQIKALKDQGRDQAAASLAQNAFANATDSMAGRVTERLGHIEKAWRGIKKTVSEAVDAMAAVGRAKTLNEELKGIDDQLGSYNPLSLFGPKKSDLESRREAVLEQMRLESRAASSESERARVQAAGVAAIDAITKANERALPKQEQLTKAIAAYRKEIETLRKADPTNKLLNDDTIRRTEQYITDSFKEKGGGKTRVSEYDSAVRSANDFIESLKVETAQIGLNADQIKMMAAAREAAKAPTAALRKEIMEQALAFQIASKSHSDLEETQKRSAQAQAEMERILKSANDEARKAIEAANKEAEASERLATTFGMTRGEIEMMELARLEEQLAQRDSIGMTLDEITTLEKLIEAKKRSVAALQRVDDLEAGKKTLDEMNKRVEHFRDRVQNTLGDGLYQAMNGNFKNIGESFKQMLNKMIADALAANLMKALMGGMTNAFSAGLSISTGGMGMGAMGSDNYSATGADVFARRASGGPVSAGKLYEVNERGPELLSVGGRDFLMMGSQGGNVTPNDKLGKTINVTYAPAINIDSRTDRAEVQALVMKAVEQGNAKLVDDLQRAGAL